MFLGDFWGRCGKHDGENEEDEEDMWDIDSKIDDIYGWYPHMFLQ